MTKYAETIAARAIIKNLDLEHKVARITTRKTASGVKCFVDGYFTERDINSITAEANKRSNSITERESVGGSSRFKSFYLK